MKRLEIIKAVRDRRLVPVARRKELVKARLLVATASRRILRILAETTMDELAFQADLPQPPGSNENDEMFVVSLDDMKKVSSCFATINSLLDALENEIGEN